MSSSHGYEASELNYALLNSVIIGVTVFVLAIFILLPIVFRWYGDVQAKQLQLYLPTQDLDQYRLKEAESLNQLKWKTKDTLIIPIDSAMRAVVYDYQVQ